jgi:hypothetical protein
VLTSSRVCWGFGCLASQLVGLPACLCLSVRVLAVLLALVSTSIVVAEATISPKLPNMSLMSRALHCVAANQTATELLCFVFLAYPCACAYYGLYKCACVFASLLYLLP